MKREDPSLSTTDLIKVLENWLKKLPSTDPTHKNLHAFFNPDLRGFFLRADIQAIPVISDIRNDLSLPEITACSLDQLSALKEKFLEFLASNPIEVLSIKISEKVRDTDFLAKSIQIVSGVKLEHAALPGFHKAMVDMNRTIEALGYQIEALEKAKDPSLLTKGTKEENLSNLLSPRYKACYDKSHREADISPHMVGIDVEVSLDAGLAKIEPAAYEEHQAVQAAIYRLSPSSSQIVVKV